MDNYSKETKRPNGGRVKVEVGIQGGFFVKTEYRVRLWIKPKHAREWRVASPSDFTPGEILAAKLEYWQTLKPTES